MKLFKYTFINKKTSIIFIFFLFIKMEKNFLYIRKPKVSIFLPIYNKEIYLRRSISSIQEQSLKNLEIISINDFSTDNSLYILKKLQKKDERIKIINNDRNHGLLYSRAMGILNCSGEYVLNLDPDDMFSNMYNLEKLYNTAKKNNTDLIIFRLKKIKMYEIMISQFNRIIKDFKSNKNNFNSKKIKKSSLITNKFMKREIILKAYKSFKTMIYGNRWNYHEDNVWSYLISYYSKSIILLKKYIYLYLSNKESLMKSLGNIVEIKNIIYRLQIENKINKNLTLKRFKKLLNMIKKYKNITKKSIEIRKKFVHIIVNFIIYFKIKKYHFLNHLIIIFRDSKISKFYFK